MKNSSTLNSFLLPVACLAAVLMCSCASTTVKNTWKAAEFNGPPLSKLAVLVVEDGPWLRRGFENRLATQLEKGGATAKTTFDLISLPDIKANKSAAAERIRGTGANAIVILRLADTATSYREVRPGSERYAETITGIGGDTWYDYYSVAYSDLSPTYGSFKQHVFLESRLFDLQTSKCVWSGVTKTVVGESMDRAAEADRVVAKIVKSMRKDGMIP